MVTLYDNIVSWENLLIAHRKAAKGKRGRRWRAAPETSGLPSPALRSPDPRFSA